MQQIVDVFNENFKMTKKKFLKDFASECFEEVGDDLKVVCEAIRKYNKMKVNDFYKELYYYCSSAHYSIISGFNMFTDSVDLETVLEVNDEILDWEEFNAIYQKVTNDIRTLREAYEAVIGEDDETVTEFVMELYDMISFGYNDLTYREQGNLSESLFEFMISVYEGLGAEVWYAPSDEEDSYGNTKYYIITSYYVEFYV